MMQPKRSRWRKGLRLFAIGTLVVFVGLTLLLAFTAGVHTEPFRDADGKIISGSVATMEEFEIGGIKQMLWFRGVDTGKPALIFLHGGPGFSESAHFRRYNNELEQHFLVVYWDQRSAGRSFDTDIPPDSINISQFVSDLDEVVTTVEKRFSKENVVLLGESWGTVIGTLYAYAHPENVAAYVGTGQVADMPVGELISYKFALSEAKARQNRQATGALEKIGSPPHTVAEMIASRKWVERFGGSVHQDLENSFWTMLQTDETSWWDIILNIRGNLFSYRHMWPEFRDFKLDERYLEFKVPVFFLEGRYDWQVPAVVAETYFEKLSAPVKELVWFEGSAHNVPFEQPDKFNQVLIEKVLPLVR